MPRVQGFMICIDQVACIFRLIACITGNDEIEQLADILSCIADLTYCTVCACMQVRGRLPLVSLPGVETLRRPRALIRLHSAPTAPFFGGVRPASQF